MAIVSTVTLEQFIDDFMEVRPNNFSRHGLSLIYDYLWDMSEDIGENIEFDIIGICCDFIELNSIEEVREYFGLEVDNYPDDDSVMDFLNSESGVIFDDQDNPEVIIVHGY